MHRMWDTGRIHAQLAVMREADADLARFGVRLHRWQPGPVLREADVRAFEARHEVTLPAA
jgi:hypothetical protein